MPIPPKPSIVCLALSVILFISTATAQYYYKDLLSLAAQQKKIALLKKQQVHRIKVISTDAEGRQVEGFVSSQEADRQYTRITTFTQTALTGEAYTVAIYDTEGKPIRTMDSSGDIKTDVTYSYANQKVATISSVTYSSGIASASEVHEWVYDNKGYPKKMWLIRNGRDTVEITLTTDEKGLVLEEEKRSLRHPPVEYYYYYDEAGKLTDVVRFNAMARRLLPDFIFEYDEQGQLGSMLVVPEDAREYQQWYYSYDEDGLKLLDACYSKEKSLIAKLEYSYTYY